VLPYSGCPIPGSRGSCAPEGTGSLGVLILGEACGEHEAEAGLPFRPHAPAGSILERAIRRCGFTREQFVLWNVVPTHPPKNWLDGAPYEAAAIAWGRPMLEKVINDYKPRAILALGNVALRTTTGLTGPLRGISHTRGYPVSGLAGIPVLGAFHPSFLRRGAMPLMSVLMDDIRLAVAIANTTPGQTASFYSAVLSRDRLWTHPAKFPDPYNPTVPGEYLTHPKPAEAEHFVRYMEANPNAFLAYDIETPRSIDTSEDETDALAEVQIESIQFSPRAGAGIFLPWRHPYDDIAKRVLAMAHRKAGANTWRFDDPLLRAHGCELNGPLHDIRWMWHHLQPDLRASLQFIASFYAPELGPWKHLHASHPEFYGIVDVDAVQRILAGV